MPEPVSRVVREKLPAQWRVLWWMLRGRCLHCGAERMGPETTRCARHLGFVLCAGCGVQYLGDECPLCHPCRLCGDLHTGDQPCRR
jgi:hypothetical protein